MADKAPYKLVVKFEGARPETIAEALAQLREIAADYDQTGESTATMTIESWQEAPLRAIMDEFELWLYRHAPGLVKEQGMVLYRPGLRPEAAEMLAREKKRTPMDKVEGFAEPLITPAPLEVLQIAAPCEEGVIVDDQPSGAGDENLFDDEAADDLFVNDDEQLEDRNGNRRPMTATERQAWESR